MLLTVLVLVASLSVIEDVNYNVAYWLEPEGNVLGSVGCYYAAGTDPVGDPEEIRLALNRPGVAAALDVCWDRFEHRLPLWLAWLELALLMTSVVVLYWVLPRWKGRRAKVVPLDGQTDPTGEVRRLVDELVAVAGLTRSPQVVIDPAAQTPSAVVFGRWGRYTVCLHGGLLARRSADPAGFRGVVLHELAHIHNRDVDITYGTVALWRVFLAVLLPANVLMTVAFLRRDLLQNPTGIYAATNVPSSVYQLLQTGFLIVLVYLARADVLRTREFYADADAAKWGADPRVWRQGAPASAGAGRGRHMLISFAGLWRMHPAWGQREQALADPVRLFGVQRLPLFLTGAAAFMVADGASGSATLGQGDVPLWAQWACAMLGAGLAAVVVGTIQWRAAVHAVLANQRGPSGIRAGLWFGAGLVTGGMGPSRTAGQWLPERPQFMFLLLLIGVVISWWTAQHAELWARTWQGGTLGPVMLLGLSATWLVFGLWFSWWQSEGYEWAQGRPIIDSEGVLQLYATYYPGLAEAGSDGLSTVVSVQWTLSRLGTDQFVFSSQRFVMWVAGALWLLPLLTCAWHLTSKAPRWARADHVRAGPGLPVRRIVRCAIGGGLLALCTLTMAKALLHDAVRPGSGWLAATLLYDSFGVLVAVTAAMVVAAWVAGNGDRTYRLLTGLVTAGLTALLGLAWSFLLTSVDGCLGRFNVVFDTCGWRPYEGWTHTASTGLDVLGPGVFTVAAALLLIPAIPRRTAPTADVQHTVSLRRRFLVAGVWATTLVFISTSGLPLGHVSSATPDGMAPSRAHLPPASSPQMRSLRVLAWLRYGGQQHLNGIAEHENAFTTAANQSFSYDDTAARVRPVCRAVERGVANARAYFPLPDAEGHRHWKDFLDQSEHAATTCWKAIDTENVQMYREAVEQMQQTYFSHRKVINWTKKNVD
ncbi:M48 family metallopeptidase [Streptomyces aureocirculatus]|uniref:M48 family metallopeptidase n=1 Tax=Streptomyces aureocirculatus TaxID=67275 RepID=UPI0004CAB365|nr:M48 family metalloprotease [Streptomyces aureocirculatus]